ncbi:MAG: (2Fe-2S)-binding protein [Prevotellaceae bacterium]|jgi:ferredoxin|nr:(2Fe-2S)-binding protein [Prevotellaceae bacterium]MDR0560855.1 (2Fe-2S)-binding protein [Prevotellaceae bacterium]
MGNEELKAGIFSIDNHQLTIENGQLPIIEYARRSGVEIPSLCYANGAAHKSSCMMCAVSNAASGQIIPACSTVPVNGMQIVTDSEEIRTVRTLSLELLLSDHRADCEAPCKIACPAGFNVAAMNRMFDAGKIEDAAEFMRDSLVIPATLCYICNAPCEKICRKKDLAEPVAIREIKKMLVSKTSDGKINRIKNNGKKTAIIGSNPAGLSAAYRLRKQGCEVTVFEKFDKILIPHIEADKTPLETVELEIGIIRQTGVKFITSFNSLPTDSFDGIISVSGDETYPDAVKLTAKTRQPARLVLEGFKLAEKLFSEMSGNIKATEILAENRIFNSTYGRFNENEKRELLKKTESDARTSGCLYCDCNSKNDCRLRSCATAYGIKNTRYLRESSLPAMNCVEAGNLRFEAAKCIRCGLCVYNSINGFTFKNRGFVMQVTLPEGNAGNVPESIAELCPTGAICRA